MTTQLPSKERLEKIVSWRETYGAGHNVMLPAEEAEAMARALLAGMEQKPVAYDQQQRDLMNSIVATAMKNNLERGDKLVMADVFAATMALMQAGFRTHPAPPISASGWIKCSDRMPEDEQEVLTINRMGHQFVSFFDEHSGLFFDRLDAPATECVEHILVTHWMPLPNVPQPEGD